MISRLNNTKISHSIPPSWSDGDIHPYPHLNALNELIETLSEGNTHLNEFNDLYHKIHSELEEGSGIVYAPNSAFSKLNKEQKKKVFFEFSKFIGKPVPINKQGELIREVKDSGIKDSVHKPARGHLTDQSLAFHSDRADITALVCDSIASSGGEFKICSSAKLFEALQEYPDILKLLSSDIPHDLRDEGNSDSDFCLHPIISTENAFVVRYIRKFVESVVRHKIQLPNGIKQALDTIDQIINTNGFYQEIIFKPGDLIFFNNHITLHSRNAFQNSRSHQRCLLRIWIASEFSRELPDSFKPIFHCVEAGGYRGGVFC